MTIFGRKFDLGFYGQLPEDRADLVLVAATRGRGPGADAPRDPGDQDHRGEGRHVRRTRTWPAAGAGRGQTRATRSSSTRSPTSGSSCHHARPGCRARCRWWRGAVDGLDGGLRGRDSEAAGGAISIYVDQRALKRGGGARRRGGHCGRAPEDHPERPLPGGHGRARGLPAGERRRRGHLLDRRRSAGRRLHEVPRGGRAGAGRDDDELPVRDPHAAPSSLWAPCSTAR